MWTFDRSQAFGQRLVNISGNMVKGAFRVFAIDFWNQAADSEHHTAKCSATHTYTGLSQMNGCSCPFILAPAPLLRWKLWVEVHLACGGESTRAHGTKASSDDFTTLRYKSSRCCMWNNAIWASMDLRQLQIIEHCVLPVYSLCTTTVISYLGRWFGWLLSIPIVCVCMCMSVCVHENIM